MSPASHKFTFDTEFLGKEDRQTPAARARQKQTLTTEELDRIQAEARSQGENSASARNIEKDKLGLALKGATDSLRDVFFSNMSERAGKILRDDMEAMGPVRLKDVDEAQMRMVNVAKDLANKGEIMISGGNGEDELVY